MIRPRYRLMAGTRGTGLSPSGSSIIPAGGIALVQSASGTTADGSAGLTVNFGVPVTAGNSVIALVSFDDSGDGGFDQAPIQVGGGNTVLDLEAQEGGATATRVGIFSNHNVSSGITGIALDTAQAVRTSMQPVEASGLADAAAEDTATSTATSTALAIGKITPTSANNLLTAIFAFNADVTAVGIANDVLVTGIGAGVYTCRGVSGGYPLYNLLGQPESADFWSLSSTNYGDGTYEITNGAGDVLNTSTTQATFPQDASWTGSTVTEIPGWELVGTRTGGASVYEYVYACVQSAATPRNPTIVLSGSADIAGAAAAFGGV